LSALPAAILEKLLEKFFKWRSGRQLRHGTVSQVHRLFGGNIYDRIYDLFSHVGYSLGPSSCGLRGKSRPSDGSGDENSQAGAASKALQAEDGFAHGRRISREGCADKRVAPTSRRFKGVEFKYHAMPFVPLSAPDQPNQ
jgi:hypothetical protein